MVAGHQFCVEEAKQSRSWLAAVCAACFTVVLKWLMLNKRLHAFMQRNLPQPGTGAAVHAVLNIVSHQLCPHASSAKLAFDPISTHEVLACPDSWLMCMQWLPQLCCLCRPRFGADQERVVATYRCGILTGGRSESRTSGEELLATGSK